MRTCDKTILFVALSIVCALVALGLYAYLQSSAYHWSRYRSMNEDLMSGKNKNGIDGDVYMYHINKLVEHGDVVHKRIELPKLGEGYGSAFWRNENSNLLPTIHWEFVKPSKKGSRYSIDVWHEPRDEELVSSTLSKYR